jgi:PKD repeat protein
LESEEFTIDQPFTDPGGVPGTITAILHYDDVQVKRKITLISGDIRFFEIEYTIKNTGSSTLNDVRFFQTIDFDIPWTSDCTDDYASYDAEHDYAVVSDGEYFNNSFKALRHSDRHGIDHWSTEIYEDWDDGNLNNANSYGPGDPGIGMQYNLGNLAPGAEEIVTITVWSGEPTVAMEPKFSSSIEFGNNKGKHHTENYPPEYNVLRRGQSFDLNADIENFDDDNHKIIFKITKPNGETQMFTAKKDGTLGSGWDPCTYERIWDWHDPLNPNKFKFKVHIPGNEQVGKYQLIGEIQKKDGDITYDTYGDDEDAPEFYVIFNPWSSEDVDVKDMPGHEISFFISNEGYEYEPYNVFLPEKWTLNPGDKEIFGTVMERASGETSASKVAEEILDLIICNAGYDGHDQFDLEHTNEGYTLPSDYGDLQHIDSFDTSEILPGYWSGINPYTHETSDGYKKATIGNVPDIIHDWKNDEKQYGQCHYFAPLGTSLLRSIGIPSRMITTIDGKIAQNPREQWNFHCWAEIWDGHSLDKDKWKAVATTEQMGPSSRCAPVLKTMTESYYCSDTMPPTPQDFVQEVLTDKVAPWLLFWWHLEKDNIVESYTSCTASTNVLRYGANSEQLEINVSTNKPEYALGEDVLIRINVTNNKDVQITENLTVVITGMASGGLMDYRFSDTKEINILPHSTITEDYVLKQEDYVINRYYTVFSYINETNGWAKFIINSRLNLTVTLPETVLINETFDVTLETKNTLGIPITNIEIQADFPYYADVTGAPIKFTIPTLAPDATNTTTWVVSMPDDGYQSMVFSAQSERGDYEQIATGTEVMSNPFLRVDVEVPSSVQKDSTFGVNVTIVNEGDLAAEDVQSTLYLPPELTTSDDLIKYIGTIDPHANTTIVWNIAANEAGTSAFTIVTNSSTTSGEDVIFIPIFIYDHDLELSVEQSQIEADGELHIINMIIHNLGNVEDSVLLQYLVTNPDISFSIYDGDERIISQPVTVPANGDKMLNLKIVPEYEATGAITIHATSELDPTASDSINIEVISPSILHTDLQNVQLLSADTTVTSIYVTSLDISQINETYKPAGVTSQSAYMTNSTGAGNFTLQFTNIPNANMVSAYKINPASIPPNQWIELDTITTATNVTFTMSVGDLPVVFGVIVTAKVAFDETHGELFSIDPGSKNSYSKFASLLKDKGYEVKTLNSSPITSEKLNNCSIFVIPAPTKPFDANEIMAVREFVSNGGNLLLINEWGGDFRQGSNLNDLSRDFGVVFNNDTVNDPTNNFHSTPSYALIHEFSGHYVTKDINEFLYPAGCSLVANNSIAWADDDSYTTLPNIPLVSKAEKELGNITVLAATNFERGRVVCIGDGDFCDDLDIDGNGRANIEEYDNKKLALNIVEWLSFGAINEPPVVSFTYSPENPVVNQTITFNASSSYDPDGTIENYEWDFGDGTNGGGEIVNYSYCAAGNYTVNLTVTDDNGAYNTYMKIINVAKKDKLIWNITSDKEEYPPGDYVIITMKFKNEGDAPVLITNPITTTFIASDGSIVLKEDLSYSISVTLGTGGQWSFGTSYKLPDDAPEGYYDVKVSISGGNYVKTIEDLFHVVKKSGL